MDKQKHVWKIMHKNFSYPFINKYESMYNTYILCNLENSLCVEGNESELNHNAIMLGKIIFWSTIFPCIMMFPSLLPMTCTMIEAAA